MTFDYYNQNAKCFYNCTVDVDMSDLYRPFLELIPDGGHILDAGCGSGRDVKAFMNIEHRTSNIEHRMNNTEDIKSNRGHKVTAFDASEELVKMAREHSGLDVQCRGFEDVDEIEVYDGIWACASLLHLRWQQRHGAEGMEPFDSAQDKHGAKEKANSLGTPRPTSATESEENLPSLDCEDGTPKEENNPGTPSLSEQRLAPNLSSRLDLLSAFAKLATALKPGGVFYCSFKYGDSEWEKDGRLFTDMNEERMGKLVGEANSISNNQHGISNIQLKIERMWITDDMREDRDDKWLNVLLRKV